MNDRHSLLDSILGAFVPIHPDGYKFVAGRGARHARFCSRLPRRSAGSAAIATAWLRLFLPRSRARDAGARRAGRERRRRQGRAITKVAPPRELQLGTEPLTRISVFLSIFDVHIVRAPVAGRIVSSTYVPGAFLNAELDKASEENERRALVIETETGEKIGLVLIAGLIARRIVTFVGEGTSVARGERIGLIRFGSRVDVYLPAGRAGSRRGRPNGDRRRDGAGGVRAQRGGALG